MIQSFQRAPGGQPRALETGTTEGRPFLIQTYISQAFSHLQAIRGRENVRAVAYFAMSIFVYNDIMKGVLILIG